MKTILWIGGGVLLALLLLFVCLWIANRRKKQKGIAGERRVAKALRRFVRKHGGRVWNNAYLPLYKDACEVDHLVFCPAGIVVVETKNVGGTVSGNGKQLTHTMGNRVHSLYNPALQNQTHVDNVQHHLRKAELDGIPVYAIVVFADPHVVLHTDAGIPLSQLPDWLARLPKRKANWQAAYDALHAIRIRSPLKKLLHDRQAGKQKR